MGSFYSCLSPRRFARLRCSACPAAGDQIVFPHPDVTSDLAFHRKHEPSLSRPRRCGEGAFCPVLELRHKGVLAKFFDTKILPASDCAPRFYSAFSANSLMAKIQGGGVPI